MGLAIELFKNKATRPTFWQRMMGIGAMLFFCFLLINLPESLLGNAESPYEFTNRGFYEQYGQSYEANHGARYFEGEKDVR